MLNIDYITEIPKEDYSFWEKLSESELDDLSNFLISSRNKIIKETKDLIKENLGDVVNSAKYENIRKLGFVTRNLLDNLRKNGLEVFSAHLKAVNWDKFDLLITISFEDIVKDDFSEIYKEIRQLKKTLFEKLNINLNIKFTAWNDDLDLTEIFYDGYKLVHKNSNEPRKA